MANHSKPIRSFNTIRNSQTKVRAKRRQTERIVLLSILATIALIVLSLLILGVCSIADAIIPDTPSQDLGNNGGDITPPDIGEIVYHQITKQSSDVHIGELIVVNENLEYQFPAINLVNISDSKTQVNGLDTYTPAIKTYKLEANAFEAFDKMMLKHYELFSDGSIKIGSAHRTEEEQKAFSTPPGYSEHHTGYCLTLRRSNGDFLESDHWIYKNAQKYGFIVRYPNDKVEITGVSDYDYCFRYVGVAHATYIAEKGYCLEEYVKLLKTSYSDGTNLKIEGADGNDYEVYYVPVSQSELTTFRVPSNYQYTISGDNDSGFIVTVNLNAPKE